MLIAYGLDIHDKNLIFKGLALLCAHYEPLEIKFELDIQDTENKEYKTGVLFK